MQLNNFSITASRRAQVAEYEPAEMSITVSGALGLNDDPATILPAVACALANLAAHAVERGELDRSKLEALRNSEPVVATAATVEVKRRPGRPRKVQVDTKSEEVEAPVFASEPEPVQELEPAPVQAPEPEVIPDPEPVKEPVVEDDFLFDDEEKPAKPKWDVSSLDAFRRQVLTIASGLGPTGAEKIRTVRATFGVDRIQDIPQTRWVEFLDKIAALS